MGIKFYLERFFGKLCSVKIFIFLCFVALRVFGLIGAEHLTAAGLSVIGINSGMKIYHTMTERLGNNKNTDDDEVGG